MKPEEETAMTPRPMTDGPTRAHPMAQYEEDLKVHKPKMDAAIVSARKSKNKDVLKQKRTEGMAKLNKSQHQQSETINTNLQTQRKKGRSKMPAKSKAEIDGAKEKDLEQFD